MEIITKLGIDVKLLAAQVVNFFILFFILSKLIYKPLLDVIKKRKEMIASSVENSKKIEERLSSLEEERTKILAEANNQAVSIMFEAKQSALFEQNALIEKTKAEMEEALKKHRIQLATEKEKIVSDVKKEMGDLILLVAEKLISKNYSPEDQKNMKDSIMSELSGMNK
jgi:F-type H+-transporting ATPase subunit b